MPLVGELGRRGRLYEVSEGDAIQFGQVDKLEDIDAPVSCLHSRHHVLAIPELRVHVPLGKAASIAGSLQTQAKDAIKLAVLRSRQGDSLENVREWYAARGLMRKSHRPQYAIMA
jgi:hypothetical protein